MKLHEILEGLGDKLSIEDKRNINNTVDEIKSKAKASKSLGSSSTEELEALVEKLKLSEDAKKKLEGDLKPFLEKKAYEADLEQFKKLGGKKDIDLSDYNYKKHTNEEGVIEWDKFLDKHPSLKNQINKDGTLGKEIISKEVINSAVEEHNQLVKNDKFSNV